MELALKSLGEKVVKSKVNDGKEMSINMLRFISPQTC